MHRAVQGAAAMVTGASAPDGPGKAKVLGTAASPRDATGPAARRNRASRELETSDESALARPTAHGATAVEKNIEIILYK